MSIDKEQAFYLYLFDKIADFWLLLNKRIISIIGVSLSLLIGILFFIYSFNFTLRNISDALFIVGFMYFATGLIQITRAGELFSGATYLTKRTFMGKKKAEHYFKTYGEYLEHKELKAAEMRGPSHKKTYLILGTVYISASLIIGMFV